MLKAIDAVEWKGSGLGDYEERGSQANSTSRPAVFYSGRCGSLFAHVLYALSEPYVLKKLTIVLQLTHIKIGDFPGNVVLPAKMFQSREKVRMFTLFGMVILPE